MIEVEEEDGCDDKFKVFVVSPSFKGVKLLQRHRLVNGKAGALRELLPLLHALTIKAMTPEEYEAKK